MDNVNPPVSPARPDVAPEVPVSFAAWLRGNALGLLIMLGVLVAGYLYFGEEGLWNAAKVALGLSFVIFIHELGHFAVAKWCDVHVETFSIGFGPALPGCSFRRGETLYKIALFPLGGYVKMLGEADGDGEEEDGNPRSFKNKSVGQRMAIITAGVVMNLISGFLFFAWVYLAHGERRIIGPIGSVDPGSPAWESGVRSDSRIRRVGTIQDPYFDEFQRTVMLSSEGERIPLVYTPAVPADLKIEVELEARRDKDNLQPLIGIARSNNLRLANDPRVYPTPVMTGSAAARAEPAFRYGDVILGTSDPQDPTKVTPIWTGTESTEQAHVRYREFRRRMEQLAGREAVIQVRRANESGEVVNITVPPAYYHTLGLSMRMGQVVAVRPGSPAQRAGVQVPEPEKNQDGDILELVEVAEVDGTKRQFVFTLQNDAPAAIVLDPARLPWELRRWADRWEEQEKAGRTAGSRQVQLRVLRKTGRVSLTLDWDELRQFDQEQPNHLASPLSVPALGLAYRIETFVAGVRPGSPAEKAGIKPGNQVKAVRFQEISKKPGEFGSGHWMDVQADQWARIAEIFQDWPSKTVGLRLERPGEKWDVELTGEPDPTWPMADRGMYLNAVEYLQTADGSFFKALELGFNKTYRSIITIYVSLKAMIVGRLSPKNMGGPIMIVRVAYDIAGQGFYEFLMFLALISVNLAVVNFLPIPLLDGGHMVFLIYEKLRGKPASERVMWVAMIAGLAIIAAIFLFASYQDVMRWLFPGRN